LTCFFPAAILTSKSELIITVFWCNPNAKKRVAGIPSAAIRTGLPALFYRFPQKKRPFPPGFFP